MIDPYNGELLNMLPSQMSKEVHQICLSYALKKGIQLIIDRSDMTRTQAMIDSLPERILDILAVELRTPYYSEDLEIDKKREIIKRTLLWHLTAGTPSAMRELISIVIGEGDIVEWPDFEDPPFTPGTFDILTDVRLTEKIVEMFIAIIERVKNERSHLRRLLLHRQMYAHWYVGVGVRSEPHITVPRDVHKARSRQYVGVRVVSVPTVIVPRYVYGTDSGQYVGVVAVSIPEVTIPAETSTLKERSYIGAALIPRYKNVISEGDISMIEEVQYIGTAFTPCRKEGRMRR